MAVAPRTLDWPTVALLAGMYALLLGNFAVYWTSPWPLPVHVAIGAVGIHLAFTIWHEGVHRNVSRIGWLNDAIGMLGIFPYMTPYFLQKSIHLQHHTRLNQADDPNVIYTDGPFATIFLRYFRIILYLKERIGADPRTRRQKLADAVPPLIVVALCVVAWRQGALLDLALLWFLPVVIAKVVMDWYINYLPHVGLPPHRYRGTRIIDLPWFTPLVVCHNYHAIHHLWPALPWHRYRSVFREKEAVLRERGVPVERRLVGYAPHPDRLAEGDSPSA